MKITKDYPGFTRAKNGDLIITKLEDTNED